MATGDILQTVPKEGAGVTSITIASGDGWSTPTSGNTLIAVKTGGDATTTPWTGWTDDYGPNGAGEFFRKTSAGTESSITMDFDSTEDYCFTLFEVEGTLTWDTGDEGYQSSGTSETATTGTLSGSTSLAIAIGLAWDFGADFTLSDSYIHDYDDTDGADYWIVGHKYLTGTSATSTTFSWDNTTDGFIAIGVYSYTAAPSWSSETEETEYVGAGADDGHIDNTSFYNSGNYAYFGQWETDGVQHMFYRFDNVAIPPKATIRSAYLNLFFDERTDGSDDLDATVYGQDEDDPAAIDSYSSGSQTWTGRTHTNASVAWQLDATYGGSPAVVNQWITSPDIKSIIQEIVDRSGWASNNAIMLFVEDDGPTPVGNDSTFEQYDLSAGTEAYIEVTYTVDDSLPVFIQLIAG